MPSSRSSVLLLLTALVAVPSMSHAEAPPKAAELRPGTALSGGAEGASYQFGSDATLRLSPGAAARILPRSKLDIGTGGAVPMHVVELQRGSIEVLAIAPKNRSAVLVRAPRRVACIAAKSRAIVNVEVDSVAVASPDGGVLAAVGDDWKPLEAGWLRAFSPRNPGVVERMLPAPAPRLARSIALSSARGGTAHVTWSAVDRARHYVVVVDGPHGERREIVAREPRAEISDLPQGSHALSVRAVDRHGIAGRDGSAGAFRVVGLSIPKDAALDAGVLRLHRGQRAQLLSADGLELTYGRSDYFVAAPKSVGLPPSGWTLMRLRDRATKTEAQLRIEPIVVRAEVDISPRLARWPADEVRVKIVPHGALPSDVSAEATVDARPVRLRWQRDANGLRAVVPTPDTKGPWVVRVDVKDSRGALIGRNFLEIARSR